MAGNPVLGFLSARPTGDGPHANVTKMLRLLGIILLVSFVVTLVSGVLGVALGASYYAVSATAVSATNSAVLTAGYIVGIVFSLVITGLVLWWITFTVNAWMNREPRGATHALIIGILATVFGALGALTGLLGGVFGATKYPMYMVLTLLSALVSAAEAYCGIMILMNRSKATAGTGAGIGTTP